MQRLLVGTTDTPLVAVIRDGDGDPVEGLTVTVTVTRDDGTTVVSGASTTDLGDGRYGWTPTSAATAQLDWLRASWRVAGVERALTVHEVVGGFLFGLAELVQAEPGLEFVARDVLRAVRTQAELEVERICGRAFVPRYGAWRLDGRGEPSLPAPAVGLRSVRAVAELVDGTESSPWTSAELAAVVEPTPGSWVRSDGGVWPSGPFIVRAEHGMDGCPDDVARAAIRRARWWWQSSSTAVPDRALAWTSETGATFRLAAPGAAATGDPEVDAVLARWSMRVGVA